MKHYSDDELKEYLTSFAPLDSYYLTCLNGAGSESICYSDGHGKSNLLLEERDDVYIAAINYLRRSGAPVFDDVLRLKAYEANMKK